MHTDALPLLKADEYPGGLWYYEPHTYQPYRYVLGRVGRHPLVCIGINPSTAQPGALDPSGDAAPLAAARHRRQTRDPAPVCGARRKNAPGVSGCPVFLRAEGRKGTRRSVFLFDGKCKALYPVY